MLKICFLGQPCFFVDGVPFKFAAPPKTLPLLAYLLLNRAASLRRDSIAYTLWPDDTEDDARSDLRRHLNYLKNALPASPLTPWVAADADTAQWNPAADWAFDVAEFERAAASASERAAAIELYTGDLLENLYDDWLFPKREQLRNLFLSSLDALLQESRSRRDLPQAVAYAQRIMAAEPWRENTLRQLLAVRYEAGDRAGALREFAQFQHRLREEMGIDPMPETLALRDVVVRNGTLPESHLTHPHIPDPPGSIAPPLLPFVGRDAELEQLHAMWSRAARGRGGTVLVGGEAVIGKSRLASELALRAGVQGGRVLVGSTSFPESMPYETLAHAFRSAAPPFSSLDVAPTLLSAIAQIVPQLSAACSNLPTLPALDPERERTRLFEAMAACLVAFSKQRPVILILEDLHWASTATIAALEYLARRMSAVSVLIVGTYREEETTSVHALGSMRRSLQSENVTAHIGLPALREESVQDLVERIPQLYGLDRDSVRFAATESQGNPLFLAAIIRNFIESGSKHLEAVPRGLQSTILARVARLSDPAQFLAQLASAVGVAFDIETLKEVSGWHEYEVLDALEELLRYQFVRESGKRTVFDFTFSHHLVQLSIYDEIDAAGRIRWHRRAAHAIERIHRARLDETSAVLARHFDRGGEPERAAVYYFRAARNALALYANDEALGLAVRGLEVTRDPQQRLELLALCESILNRQGRRAEQAVVLDELERTAVDARDDAFLCESNERRIMFHRALGERERELACIETLASRAESMQHAHWVARATHALASYEISVGKLPEARRALDAALAGYKSVGDTRGEAECLCIVAYADVISLKTSASETALARAKAVAGASGNQELLAHTYLGTSTAALVVMDYVLSGQLAERALECYRAIGDREGEADSLARLGVVAARRFDIVAARTWYAKAGELYGAVGKKQGLGAVALNTGLMEFAIGRVDRACEACLEAEQIFSNLGDVRGTAVSSINLAMAHYHRGDHPAARELARRGLELARQLGSAPLEAAALGNLGAVERELGDLSASLEHLRASIALRRASGAVGDASLDLAELLLTQIELKNATEAQRLADELMDLDPGEYAMTWAPQTIPLAAAHAYRALRKNKRAEEATTLARRLFGERMGMIPDAEGRASYAEIPFNRELCSPRRGAEPSRARSPKRARDNAGVEAP